MLVYEQTSSMKILLTNEICATADPVRREQKVRVFHKAMEVEVGPLRECELKTFLLNTRELVK